MVDHIWPNFALFRLGRPVANLHAKFEVSSFNRSWDMGGPEILDVGQVAISRPILT